MPEPSSPLSSDVTDVTPPTGGRPPSGSTPVPIIEDKVDWASAPTEIPTGFGRPSETPPPETPAPGTPAKPTPASPFVAPGGGPTGFGPYEILGELGRGGMGVVYKAYHRSLKRECALKTLSIRLTGDKAASRFIQEAQAVARLGKHPHIVQVFDCGVAQGIPFFAMEYIDGEPLDKRIKRLGGRSEEELLEVGRKIALALDHAHRRGIVHRDVKPPNIILDRDGEPHLLDFGVAKDLRDEPGAVGDGTESDEVIGTPSYMAPEQWDPRQGPLDARADIYALGATLYYAAAGEPPFTATSALDLLVKVATADAPPLTARTQVGGDFQAIVQHAMEKRPARRYQTALEMADDLSRVYAGRPPRARPVGPAGRLTRWAGRNPELAAGALLVVVLLGALAAWFAWRKGESEALWRDLSRQIAASTTHEVRALVDPTAPLLEELRALARVGLLPVDDPVTLGEHLVARFRYHKRLSWLSYGDAEGRFTGAWRDAKGTLLLNQSWHDASGSHLREDVIDADGGRKRLRALDEWPYDPRTRPFYKLAEASSGLVWTPPYDYYDGGGVGITAALALRDGTRVRGVFTADFVLDEVSRFLEGLVVGKTGRAFLLTREGKLLAGPSDKRQAALLAAGMAQLPQRLDELRPGPGLAAPFEHEGERWFAAFEVFAPADGLLWAIATVVPEDDFVGDVKRHARHILAIELAIGGACVFAGIAMAIVRRRRLWGAVRATSASGRFCPPSAPI